MVGLAEASVKLGGNPLGGGGRVAPLTSPLERPRGLWLGLTYAASKGCGWV
jgi:hypothetical protein